MYERLMQKTCVVSQVTSHTSLVLLEATILLTQGQFVVFVLRFGSNRAEYLKKSYVNTYINCKHTAAEYELVSFSSLCGCLYSV